MPPVDLVREYKGPTVEQVLAASEAVSDLLPGRVATMERAIETDDLKSADERIDQTLGLLLAGPGNRPVRRAWGSLWVWCGLAAAVVGAIWWLTWTAVALD